MLRKCPCGQQLKVGSRPDARFCSTRCRVAAHRKAHSGAALAELRRRPRWVRWKTVIRRGKTTRMPLTTSSEAASSTDPETWTTHANATRSKVGRGVGFVLNGDGIVCVDVDNCVTNGVVEPWAQDVLDAAGDTYVELSPSGRGLHVWGYGVLPAGRVLRVPGGRVECYGAGRFITVTGDQVGSCRRFGDLSAFLKSVGAV